MLAERKFFELISLQNPAVMINGDVKIQTFLEFYGKFTGSSNVLLQLLLRISNIHIFKMQIL